MTQQLLKYQCILNQNFQRAVASFALFLNMSFVAGGIGSLALSVLVPTEVYAHGDEGRVALEIDTDPSVNAGDIHLSFQLIDSKKRAVISDRELSVVHEKKLHIFIFDPALREFRHEHPEYVGSVWQAQVNLPINGNYWIWAQGELMDGREEFSAPGRLEVKGGVPAHPSIPVLGDVRSGVDGNSVVTLSQGHLVAKKGAMLDVSFSRQDRTAPQITPWLGAPAHVVAVLSDGDTLVHVHPMDHGNPGHFMLHVQFPAAGDYRLWVQFQDGGRLRTVPLSVTVYSR